jgi:glycosyltransferase involved in cell wall biosynthesis
VQGAQPASVAGRHVVFFNWRDTANPEGGGSERYVERMARGLVAHGARATVFCAAHDRAPADEVVDGVRFVRRGTKLGVYVQGVLHLLRRTFGPVDVVVDVQNGLPLFTRLATRRPVVVLVHHVHREQWPVVYPGTVGRIGWWVESRMAPRLYRRSQYVAVSRATRDELVQLGVGRDRIAVVHNGTDPAPHVEAERAPEPTICVVGRLVPHKQVEHAVDVVRALRADLPDLRLTIVGSGWWEDALRKYVAESGTGDLVTFTGHVSEHRKHQIYKQSWLMLLPSLKEGWGLVVGEAGSHGVPTVAYASAGGTRESIRHRHSGLLVEHQHELADTVRRMLVDHTLRKRLGDGARTSAHQFTWGHSQGSFVQVVSDVLAGRRVTAEDPDEVAG